MAVVRGLGDPHSSMAASAAVPISASCQRAGGRPRRRRRRPAEHEREHGAAGTSWLRHAGLNRRICCRWDAVGGDLPRAARCPGARQPPPAISSPPAPAQRQATALPGQVRHRPRRMLVAGRGAEPLTALLPRPAGRRPRSGCSASLGLGVPRSRAMKRLVDAAWHRAVLRGPPVSPIRCLTGKSARSHRARASPAIAGRCRWSFSQYAAGGW
jgi:hypothetical protein